MNPGITERPFGILGPTAVTEYTLSNSNGMQVSVINYGAIITKIITPDKNGVYENVIWGFNSLDEYIKKGNQYIGCIVGRYCNRIAHGKFTLDGKEYLLARNNNNNSLHGGMIGFDKVCWQVENLTDHSLKLTYLSKDGEEGFPGNMNVEVTYILTDNNELQLFYSATTDKATPINLTSHCYFNLSGGNEKSILNHELKINADLYTHLNTDAIPTSELVSVNNDRLDFRTAKKVGRDIYSFPGGYDINFVLNKMTDYAAELFEPNSGRYMEMFTTEPGLQFYSANMTENTVAGGNIIPTKVEYAALCLEAQHFPDSPNHKSFPNTILRRGETYRQRTIYKFSVK